MTFQYPMALWGISLILFPILIHLFRFSNYTTFTFSNSSFLQQLLVQSNKAKSVKQWMQLLIRCLSIICLAFAFAQPSIKSDSKLTNSNHSILIIDNSFSSQSQSKGVSILTYILSDLKSIIHKSPPNSEYTIITSEGIISGTNPIQIAEASELIQTIQSSPNQLDWNTVNQYLSNTNAIANIHLFSDIRKHSLPQIDIDSENFNWQIHAYNPDQIDNVTVSKFQPLFQRIPDPKRVDFLIEYNAFGSLPTKFQYSIRYNNTILASGTKTLQKSIEQDTIQLSIDTSIQSFVEIVLTENSNNFDNAVQFPISNSRSINLLVIASNQSNIWSALDASDILNVTQINQENFQTADVSNFDAIILSEETPSNATIKRWEQIQKEGNQCIQFAPKIETKFGTYSWTALEINNAKIQNPKPYSIIANAFVNMPKNLSVPTVNQLAKIIGKINPIIETQSGNPIVSQFSEYPNSYAIHTSLDPTHSNLANHAWFPLIISCIATQSTSQSNLLLIPYSNSNSNPIIQLCNSNTCIVPIQTRSNEQIQIPIINIGLQGLVYAILQETRDTLSAHYIPASLVESDLTPSEKAEWETRIQSPINWVTSLNNSAIEIEASTFTLSWVFLCVAVLFLLLNLIIEIRKP